MAKDSVPQFRLTIPVGGVSGECAALTARVVPEGDLPSTWSMRVASSSRPCP